MGILDFIHERDADRFGADRQDRWLVAPGFPESCPVCRTTPPAGQTLTAHMAARHPARLPTLARGGTPVLGDIVLDRDIPADAWQLADTTEVEVRTLSGNRIATGSPSELGRLLAEVPGQRCRLVLRGNSRFVISEFHLLHLGRVDGATVSRTESSFLRAATTWHAPSGSPVEAFHAFGASGPACAPDSVEALHHGALYRYLEAILLKDGSIPRVTRDPASALREAREHLVVIRTPLATAVRTLIDFNLNAFAAERPARLASDDLRHAFAFFGTHAALLARGEVTDPGQMRSSVPIDNKTARIVALASEQMKGKPPGTEDLERIGNLRGDPRLMGEDRQKLEALRIQLRWDLHRERPAEHEMEALEGAGFPVWLRRFREDAA